jgi:hypothetical protein
MTVSKFKMFLEIEKYVHNHYDFIIVASSTLLMIVWKTIIWDNTFPPPMMFSYILMFLIIAFRKSFKNVTLVIFLKLFGSEHK